MAGLAKNLSTSACRLCFIIQVVLSATATTVSTVPSGPYSSRCASPSPAADQHTGVDDASALLRSFQITSGIFSGGGADTLFSPRSQFAYFSESGFSRSSFSLLPHAVSRTTEPSVLHLTATLTLTSIRVHEYYAGHAFSSDFRKKTHSISFYLDGYYSFATAQLCMVGMGSEISSDGSIAHYADVTLQLRIPSPSSLTDPFVTGSLKGADFEPTSLVSYTEGSSYRYSENSTCLPVPEVAAAARRAIQTTPDGDFSCATLKARLTTWYGLEYGRGHAIPSLREPRMYINQVHCTASGAVRVYAVLSNDTTTMWGSRGLFLTEEGAVVADGHWDSDTNRLCLRACLVAQARSLPAPETPSTRIELEVRECGIGMSFWFPAVWTVRDRSVTAGVLWNATSTQLNSSDDNASVGSDALITASSFEKFKGNVSDVNYNYNFTMIDEAKRHYLKARLSTSKKKSKVSFPGNYSYSYRDFDIMFFLDGETGNGRAYPVTIGSAMVDGDKLAAENSFSWHAAAQLEQGTLVNVSYGVMYSVAPKNWSFIAPLVHRHIWAEGVYDPTTGFLCMVGCGELNGSMDCQILITVQFSSFGDSNGFGHGRGRISSLRDSTDRLYFPKRDLTLFGMYSHEVSESIWRMDTETVVVVISTTLTCVFTVLQILHTKRNPRAAASTSITMLAVQALGLVTPLVVNSELLVMNKRKQLGGLDGDGWLRLNELMLRVPTLIALALQLRLLQLAWSGRTTAACSSEGETSPAAERKVLRTCLPLYLLGAAVTAVVHVVNVRAAREAGLVDRRFAPAEATTLWADLASYAGLVLDGFLLPQVVFNAASGSSSRVRAISPWFYAGGTVIRAAPHAYDAFRAVSYAATHVYASSRDDFFGVAWDIVVPLGAALLAFVLFLQQRLGGDLLLRSRNRRRPCDYQLVSTFQR
uniref:RING-type E3 ubiquitin transferase n=1 Tax=Oryza rufipogon TaxID=4529 RepID=A0A0E0N0Q6_ORYRU